MYTKRDIKNLRKGKFKKVGKGYIGRKLAGKKGRMFKGVLKKAGFALEIAGIVNRARQSPPHMQVNPQYDRTINGKQFNYYKAYTQAKTVMVVVEAVIAAMSMIFPILSIIQAIASLIGVSVAVAEEALGGHTSVGAGMIDPIAPLIDLYIDGLYKKWEHDMTTTGKSDMSQEVSMDYHYTMDQEEFFETFDDEMKEEMKKDKITEADKALIYKISTAEPKAALGIFASLSPEQQERIYYHLITSLNYTTNLRQINPGPHQVSEEEVEEYGDVPDEFIDEIMAFARYEITYEELSPEAADWVQDIIHKRDQKLHEEGKDLDEDKVEGYPQEVFAGDEVLIGSHKVVMTESQAEIFNAWADGDYEPLKNASKEDKKFFDGIGVEADKTYLNQYSAPDAYFGTTQFEVMKTMYVKLQEQYGESLAQELLDYEVRRGYGDHYKTKDFLLLMSYEKKYGKDMSEFAEFFGIVEQKLKLLHEAEGLDPEETDDSVYEQAVDEAIKEYGELPYGENWDKMAEVAIEHLDNVKNEEDDLFDAFDLLDDRFEHMYNFMEQEDRLFEDYNKKVRATLAGGENMNALFQKAGAASLHGGKHNAHVARKRARFN